MNEIPDHEILPLTMEHNLWTWSAQAHVNPISVTKAKGVYFWDADGKRYLDFNSMVMCVNIGHGEPRVIDAIARQARELCFAGPQMATRPRAILGKMLAEVMPAGIDRFLYTLGGAEANENAIKIARAYTGRNVILTSYRSYHGATNGAITLTGDPRRLMYGDTLMPGVVHFLGPYRYRSTFHRNNPDISDEEFSLDYLNHLEEIIQFEGPGRIAAILLEPVTGTNGIIIPPDGYLSGVR
ncbi:MAG: aminotransferase class III-fold pyridoxal phosphate-dependent enzyme, partial [Anaerolineaceae bacterium]|nr:aminotransferase class III-fold pyridoxal phosphate-dependent enzyme [Anaerolineaceae bacterium]